MHGRRGTRTTGHTSGKVHRRSEAICTRTRGGATMNILTLLLVLPAAEPDTCLPKMLLPVYVKEAEAYSVAVESAPKEQLELKKEPIFEWSNPGRSGVQQGVVFLWLRDGRPVALASIFSSPDEKLPGRRITHELHALDA